MKIEAASPPDLPDVEGLLRSVALPADGAGDRLGTTLVAREDSRLVGTAALELYADGALLRSVAVEPGLRGRRIGHQLTEAAMRLAETHGADAVFLLTTTAQDFFPRFGFERITRDEVPESVKGSVEFGSACCASAVVMRKQLIPHGTKTVLFACVHNAGRSQMAAAWFNRLADPAKARAISAGTQPADRVHPEVVAAMLEVGIDLADAATTRLTQGIARQAQVLVTMGCGDECPSVPGAAREDWPLEDPKGKPIAAVREIRDQIRDRVQVLIEREGWSRGSD